MTCAFITSNGPLKLFNVGNYSYEICRLVNGELKVVKSLFGCDYEEALKIFKECK